MALKLFAPYQTRDSEFTITLFWSWTVTIFCSVYTRGHFRFTVIYLFLICLTVNFNCSYQSLALTCFLNVLQTKCLRKKRFNHMFSSCVSVGYVVVYCNTTRWRSRSYYLTLITVFSRTSQPHFRIGHCISTMTRWKKLAKGNYLILP